MAQRMTVDLHGVIDMHLHSAPDVEPRRADDIETARAAAAVGMRAIVLKSHVTLTADRAAIAERVVPGIRVFGGLVLNYPVGGCNPDAVEVAIRLGAREIWMPTKDAAHERAYREQAPGISILDGDGKLFPAISDILDLIRAANVILGTGHLSIPETITLVRAARQRGLRKIIITHPEAYFIRMPIAIQRDLAALGAFIERCYVFTTAIAGATISVAGIAQQMREVGIESTVLATDLGQPPNPPPVEGMRDYLALLRAAGLSDVELNRAAKQNSAELLGLA